MEFEAFTDRALLFVACYSVPHFKIIIIIIIIMSAFVKRKINGPHMRYIVALA